MMEALPTELIFKICGYLQKIDLKRFGTVNTRISIISQLFLFKNPSLSRPMHLSQLDHLPIQIIRNSQLCGLIKSLQSSIRVVIMDTRFPRLNPKLIRYNPEIQFILSINFMRQPNEFQQSMYLLPNVRLMTTPRCAISMYTLYMYREFTFQHIATSHIEVLNSKTLEKLSNFKIERLIFDFCYPIEPRMLLKFKNIVYISSSIFRVHKFPVDICNKLTALELVSINTAISNFSIFKKFKNCQFFDHRDGRIFSQHTGYRHPFSLRIKPIKSTWMFSLEKSVVRDTLLLF